MDCLVITILTKKRRMRLKRNSIWRVPCPPSLHIADSQLRLCPSRLSSVFGKRELARPIKRYSRKFNLVAPNSGQTPISFLFQALHQNQISCLSCGFSVGKSTNTFFAQCRYFCVTYFVSCPGKTHALRSPI